MARATAGKGNQDSYCEYTGGGDIYIAKNEQVQRCSLQTWKILKCHLQIQQSVYPL